MSFATDQIRNIAIAGHGSTGKTTLLEHILFQGGSIAKPETIESGKTVSDYNEEEISRKISVRSTLTHCLLGENKINFIDTPGSSDFVGEVILAFRACESALMLIDAKTGEKPGFPSETQNGIRHAHGRGTGVLCHGLGGH
jgi:elongation factor G